MPYSPIALRQINTSELSGYIETVAYNLNSGQFYPRTSNPSGYLLGANNLSGVASPSGAFDYIKQTATTGYGGVVRFATTGEAAAGTGNSVITPQTLQQVINPISISRVGSDQIISDGVTTNRAQIQVPTSRGNLAGAASATWRGLVYIPANNPAVTLHIAALSSSATSVGVNNGFSLYINTSGNLVCDARGAAAGSDIRTQSVVGVVTAFAGRTVILELRLTNGTAAPEVWINDVAQTFAAVFTSGAAPSWLDVALVATYHLTGYNWPAGPTPLGCWINGGLTAADRAYWTNTGKPPVWVTNGGSTSSLTDLTGVGGNFSSNPASGPWPMLLDAGITWTGSAVDFNTTGPGFIRSNSALSSPDLLRVGRRYWVRFTISNYVSGTFSVCRANGVPFPVVSGTATLTGNGTATCIVEEIAATDSRIMIGSVVVTPHVATLDDLYWGPIGAISLPSVQPINVIDDVTSIGGNPARLLGMIPVTENRWWRINAETATSGNQQLLGGELFDSSRDVIDSIEQVTTGTPTTTIGSSTGGSQYKTSGALSAGINPSTLVTRKIASNSVWIGSNTTGVVRTTIAGHRAN